MPLYSFVCRACRQAADFTRKIENRDNPAFCTKCESWSSRRIMTAPGLIGETVVREQRTPPLVHDRDYVDAEHAETAARVESVESRQ